MTIERGFGRANADSAPLPDAGAESRGLAVAYVTVQFPEPSETFATNEVRALMLDGVHVTVHGLRRRHPRALEMLRERELSELSSTHNGLIASLRGTWEGITRPRSTLSALLWIVRSNWRKPRDVLISLMLLPRAMDVLALIERARPDVVHMYWGHLPTIVGRLVQRRLPAIATSVSIVAYDLVWEYGGAVEVLRGADLIRTHTDANRPRIARFAGVDSERVAVIYNGVDIGRLQRIRERQGKVRHRIATAGRLTQKKGMRDVIEAFALVRRTWPDASLVVLGDGPDRSDLLELCQRRGVDGAVEFLGHVPHDRVIEELAKSEVFMLLSRSEGERLPNVVKEGMVCGCACITTPTIGIGELVEHMRTGFVVPMSDSRAASEAVNLVFAGDVDIGRMTRDAKQHIVERFDLYKSVRQYQDLWRDAAIRAKRREPALKAGASASR